MKTRPFGPSEAEGGGPVLKEKPKGQRRLGLTVQGRSFSSKPNVIAFKNFDVGKIYKLKAVLTNVSYTSNFCRYKGMSEHLEDYVSVRFKPPGQISAGMSFELMVTFEGTVSASSHTGRASDGVQEQSALGVSIAPKTRT
ncbi:cilia- and flagella-associated protein 74-like [Lethenteron reissneri]|uniref:cilia- and flagella-associated protein 74-like n=1 Tax=Lethenteron reissneri TaxID=7753 RepID=UPI002AB64AEE|nr:cilia- and flagella-associated protein 74-like [Lethenteron reissneri]